NWNSSHSSSGTRRSTIITPAVYPTSPNEMTSKAVAVLRPAVDQARGTGAPVRRSLGVLALGVGCADGLLAGLAVVEEIGLPEQADQVAHTDSLLLTYRGTLRVRAGQLRAGVDDLATHAARQRADGDLTVFPTEHYMLAFGRYLTGSWADALISADHTLVVSNSLDQPYGLSPGHAVAAMVHAQRGQAELAESFLDACRRYAPLFPEQNCLYPVLAAATLAQARADLPAMREALQALASAEATPGTRTLWAVLWVPLYAEAFTTTDRPTNESRPPIEEALHTFDQLADRAPALTTTSHWLHARAAAERGDTDAARDLYRQAVAAPVVEGDDIPLHRAFAHRDLAALLLAAGGFADRREADGQLREAHRIFTMLGAVPYAERAAQALARLGTTTPVPPAGGREARLHQLTDREQAVAHLAAQGLTNQEIARELFGSTKTVEYHLGHVYTKLDLTGRRQLRTAGV
ncbi:LuxR C-terminal-related transcriptional regulator, partial [Kitasatospora sp. NPDC048540]|uniref:helix-turn-helix transcriptional regulator n=1 Tax=Kitasatospora sp. NPDC048540 TaxID=3155634 RepID=UPI0033F80A6A